MFEGPKRICQECGAVEEALGLYHRPTCSVAKAAYAATVVPARKRRAVHLYTGPFACIYCASKVGQGGVVIHGPDGDDYAHQKCHQKACED